MDSIPSSSLFRHRALNHRVLLAVMAVAAGCADLRATPVLLHHYDFDQPQSQAQDAVGSAHGALRNGAIIADGYLKLDGNDDFVQFDQYLIPTGFTPFSVQIRAQDLGQRHPLVELISQGLTGSPAPNFFLGYDPAHRFRISDNIVSTAVLFPTDSQFHTYTVTMDTASSTPGTRLYVDGLLMGIWGPLPIAPAGEYTRFGTQFYSYPEQFYGNIDYVSIYQGALSADAIHDLLNPPSPGGDTDSGNTVPDTGGTLGLLGLSLLGVMACERQKSKTCHA